MRWRWSWWAQEVATTNGIDRVTTSWQEVTDAEGDAIHRDLEVLQRVAAGNSADLDTEVTAGQEYCDHVRAQDPSGNNSAPTHTLANQFP